MPNGVGMMGTLGTIAPLADISSGLGRTIGTAFAGPSPYEQAIDPAMQSYRQYMQEAQRVLGEHEAAGREDVGARLRAAQLYGAPYREAGAGALGTYTGSLGLGGTEAQQAAQRTFQTSPEYQFALEEGLKAIRRGMAPTGLRGSGAEQKELMRYGMGLAGQEYGTWQDRLSKLAGLGAETGERAATRETGAGSLLAQLGLGYGGKLAGLYGDIGTAQAESILARAQAEAQREAERRESMSQWGPMGGILSALF